MKLYTGSDPYNGWQFLVTDWEDGNLELATRADTGGTWGPPITLAPESSGAAS